jgi:hypothetical protein
VAEEMEITNGHAARMRYSRFKNQMEGVPATKRPRGPKTPKPPKAQGVKAKIEKSEPKDETHIKNEAEPMRGIDNAQIPAQMCGLSSESASPTSSTPSTPRFLKMEPLESRGLGMSAVSPTAMNSELKSMSMSVSAITCNSEAQETIQNAEVAAPMFSPSLATTEPNYNEPPRYLPNLMRASQFSSSAQSNPMISNGTFIQGTCQDIRDGGFRQFYDTYSYQAQGHESSFSREAEPLIKSEQAWDVDYFGMM